MKACWRRCVKSWNHNRVRGLILPNPQVNPSKALQRALLSLRLVCAELPHLSGLAAVVRLRCDDRVPVAAVSRFGDVLINPNVFQDLSPQDAAYVLAHELMHLALDTFSREGSHVNPRIINVAHDYIINDLLTQELGRVPPLGGLYQAGMSSRSLEDVVTKILRQHGNAANKLRGWSPDASQANGGTLGCGKSPKRRSDLSRALEDAGLIQRSSAEEEVESSDADSEDISQGDVIWGEAPQAQQDTQTQARREKVRAAAANVLAVHEIRQLDALRPLSGEGEGHRQWTAEALRSHFKPPWESALQTWLEGQMPGDRSYARPSRRGADRMDVVLPGRLKTGWTLHIILDTSGSMLSDLPLILGLIGNFCEGCGVQQLHIVQCGDELTADEWVETEHVGRMELIGGGGGGLSPGFDRLGEDPEVQSAIVITDTYEEYPETPPPFDVLWAVLGNRDFQPPYGTAVFVEVQIAN